MRRAQIDDNSQIIKNFAYNPSFEAAGISILLRTNNATNPSLETAGASQAVRSNLLSNPSAETASGTVNVRTNLVTNPSFAGASGVTTVRANYLTNPSMETASGTITTRTNLALNPSAVLGPGWFGANGVAGTGTTGVSGGPLGGKFARLTATGTATGMNYFAMAYGSGVAAAAIATAGTVYTLSAYIRITMTNFTQQPRLRMRWKDAAGVTLGDLYGDLAGQTSGAWARLSVTGTAPANTAYIEAMGGYQSIDQATITVGDTVDVSAVLIEATNGVSDYFDGSTPITNLCTNPSFEVDSSGWGSYLSTISRDTAEYRSGVASLKVVTTGAGGPSLSPNIASVRGITYTQSMWVKAPNGQSMTLQMLQYDASSVNVKTTSSPFTGTGAWQRVSITDTIVASATKMTPYVYASVSGVTFWVDDVLVEPTSILNDYYSGQGDYTYVWSGTANASTSTQRATGMSNWLASSTASVFQSSVQKNSLSKSLGVVTKGGNGDGTYAADITGLIVGATYTFSAWVKTTSIPNLTMVMRWKDSGQVTIGSDSQATVTTTIGVWTRVSITAVAPAGAVYLQPMMRIYSVHQSTVFYVDDALIERASTMQPYFDGTTVAAGDFTYAWAGTAHASQSYQQAPAITGWLPRWYGSTGGNGAFYQAKGGVSGTYARKLWTSENTGSSMDVGINPTTNIPISINTPYTLSAWVRCSVAQYFNLYIEWKDAGNVSLGATQQSTGTLVPANTWTRLSVTATSPATGTQAVPTIGPYAQAAAMPAESTLDVDHVLFEQSPGMLDYFDGANPIQNLVTNPSFEGNSLTSWAGKGSTLPTLTTDPIRVFSPGGYSLKMTMTSSSVSQGVGINVTGLTVGLMYTMSGYVFIPAGNLDVVSTISGIGYGTNVATRDTWTRTTMTFTATATTHQVGFDCVGAQTGKIFYLDCVMLNTGPTALPYVEGTGDFTYVWSGAANASTSYQQAAGVSGAGSVSTLAIAYQSKTSGITSGTKSIRITPTNISNGDSFFDVNGMLGGVTFKPNTTYTISGNRTILAPQTNINGVTSFRIRIGATELTPTLVSGISNVAGTQRVVARFTTVSSTTVEFVRFYNGSYFGGGDVWWDDLMLEEGTTNGQYFDGANPIQNLISNTNFEVDANGGWYSNTGTPTLTADSAQAWLGTKSMKLTSTVASADIASTTSVTLQPSTTYTLSWYVYSPDARVAYFDLAASPNFNLPAQGSKAVPANTWTRISGTFTTPNSLSTQVAIYFHHGGGPTTVGTSLWMDAVLLEKSTTLNPYYSGLGDFTYAWNGTANASISEQRAPLIADRQAVGGSSTSVYQSSIRSLSGTKSGAIFTKGSWSSDATLMYPATDYWTGGGNGQLTSNVKNTWSMWVWVPSGSGQVRLQDVTTGTIGNPNTLYDQWERISVTFVGGAGSVQHILRLRTHTAMPAGTVIWWDNEMIESAPAAGSYFDGSTVATSDFTNAWTGTANASASTQKVNSLSGGIASRNSGAVPDSKFYMYQTTDESGKKIARWVAPAGTDGSGWRVAGINSASFDWSSIKAGGVYTLFYRFRSSGWGTNNTAFTMISTGGATNHVINTGGTQYLNQSATLTQWQEYRRAFTALRDGDNTQQLYISLPTLPSPTMDGIFDLRDWMITEGDYKGDYVDGNDPFSKWTGAVNSSVSIGYPQQFLNIAGAPMASVYIEGTTLAPISGGAFDDCTVYHVYEVYSPVAEWTSTASIGGWSGSNADYTTKGVFTYGRRNGGDLATSHSRVGNSANSNVSGMGTAVPGLIQGFKPNQRHVITMQITDGATILRSTLNGGAEAAFGFSAGNGIAREAIKMRTGISNTDGTASTAAKGLVLLYFPGRHSDATRLAMSRYLGNKYGANVA